MYRKHPLPGSCRVSFPFYLLFNKTTRISSTMKLTSVLLAIGIAPLAMTASFPPPCKDIMASDPMSNLINSVTCRKESEDGLSRRGLIDDMHMKEKCKSTFNSDKTKYKAECTNAANEDAKNLCMLRSLLGDAPADCRAAMVKSMDF